MAETFLGQILHEGQWLDYARGTEQDARIWQAGDTENRRVVDWIDKDEIIFPVVDRTLTHTCTQCGMNERTDDLTIIGRNCPATAFEHAHTMVRIKE